MTNALRCRHCKNLLGNTRYKQQAFCGRACHSMFHSSRRAGSKSLYTAERGVYICSHCDHTTELAPDMRAHMFIAHSLAPKGKEWIPVTAEALCSVDGCYALVQYREKRLCHAHGRKSTVRVKDDHQDELEVISTGTGHSHVVELRMNGQPPVKDDDGPNGLIVHRGTVRRSWCSRRRQVVGRVWWEIL